MLTIETIQHETIWVGQTYEGHQIVGTWDEIGYIDESAFSSLDIASTERQPEILRDFYEKYLAQDEYDDVFDYFENVYSKEGN